MLSRWAASSAGIKTPAVAITWQEEGASHDGQGDGESDMSFNQATDQSIDVKATSSPL